MAATFVFQLEPVSVERIDILEAKLRDVQDELEATKRSLAQNTTLKMARLQAESNNVAELNKGGQIVWNAIDQSELKGQFELTNERTEIRFLVPGWYMVSVMTFLVPKKEGARVLLCKNGGYLEEIAVPFIENQMTSAPIFWSDSFAIGDTLSVKAERSPSNVGGGIVIQRQNM